MKSNLRTNLNVNPNDKDEYRFKLKSKLEMILKSKPKPKSKSKPKPKADRKIEWMVKHFHRLMRRRDGKKIRRRYTMLYYAMHINPRVDG